MSREFRYTGRFREHGGLPFARDVLGEGAVKGPRPDKSKGHDMGCPKLRDELVDCTCRAAPAPEKGTTDQ